MGRAEDEQRIRQLLKGNPKPSGNQTLQFLGFLLFVVVVIGGLLRLNSLKSLSKLEQVDSNVWHVYLDGRDEWFDTNIKVKPGETITTVPRSGGSYLVSIGNASKLVTKSENISVTLEDTIKIKTSYEALGHEGSCSITLNRK